MPDVVFLNLFNFYGPLHPEAIGVFPALGAISKADWLKTIQYSSFIILIISYFSQHTHTVPLFLFLNPPQNTWQVQTGGTFGERKSPSPWKDTRRHWLFFSEFWSSLLTAVNFSFWLSFLMCLPAP